MTAPWACEQAREHSAELALDVLPADQRDLLLEHLDGCPSCQALVDDLASAADHLLLALPEADPPPGFAERVVAALPASPSGASPGGAAPLPRRAPRRRRLLLVAAAALVLGGVAATVAVVVSARHEGTHHIAMAFELTTPSGADIGEVRVGGEQETWLWFRLEAGPVDGDYGCQLDLDDGRTVDVGTMTANGGEGEWGYPLPIEVGRIKVARVVDPDGATVAEALLH